MLKFLTDFLKKREYQAQKRIVTVMFTNKIVYRYYRDNIFKVSTTGLTPRDLDSCLRDEGYEDNTASIKKILEELVNENKIRKTAFYVATRGFVYEGVNVK